MIRAKHTWLHRLFFRNYFRYILRKDFREIILKGTFDDKGWPILLICNHISWWDGFFPYEINLRCFKRRFHIMMLEDQLRRIIFFRRLGAFSINPGKRSAPESLNYAKEILTDSRNMLVLFPQGRIHSQYTTDIKFRKGWFRIVKNSSRPVQIIFMASLTDYFSYRKPSLYVYIENYHKSEDLDFYDVEKSYNNFYLRSLEKQKMQQ
ncbi:MAG: lysophospholipid acyltransferase family protein [Bacteroidales bacterium]